MGEGTLLDPSKTCVSSSGSRMTAGLLLGQLLSLLLASAGLFSSLLAAKVLHFLFSNAAFHPVPSVEPLLSRTGSVTLIS